MSTRVAVVSGASRKTAIGHAIAHKLHKSGYRVVGIDTKPAEEGTVFHKHPDSASLLQLDLSDEDAIAGLPGKLKADYGLDVCHCIVNNAGIADPYLPSKVFGSKERRDGFRKYIQVNLMSAFLLSDVLIPLMPKGDASIINISSVRAFQSEANSEGYGTSKAGLVGLTHTQAATLAGVARVNCVCPGWIDTSGDLSSQPDEYHKWHWTGSLGHPNDIAEMVAFLADGSKSRFITGQVFVIDGGVNRRFAYDTQ